MKREAAVNVIRKVLEADRHLLAARLALHEASHDLPDGPPRDRVEAMLRLLYADEPHAGRSGDGTMFQPHDVLFYVAAGAEE